VGHLQLSKCYLRGFKGLMNQGCKDSRPALSRRGDYLKNRLSFIMMIVY